MERKNKASGRKLGLCNESAGSLTLTVKVEPSKRSICLAFISAWVLQNTSKPPGHVFDKACPLCD